MSDKGKGKTEDRIDSMIREMERRTGHSNRRVGTRERSMHQEYVNEAFAAGYLDESELGERIAKIQGAKYARDLNSTTDDLPSYAELKGRSKLPEKTEKQAAWIFRFYMEDHPVFGPMLSLILALLIAVVPGVSLASLHLTNVFPFSLIMALTIVVGAVTGLFSLFRLMWVMFDDM